MTRPSHFLMSLRWLICAVRGQHLWQLPAFIGGTRAECRVCASCNRVEWID